MSRAFAGAIASLSPAGRRAATLAAASFELDSAPLYRALRREGLDADAALADAESAGVLVVEPGQFRFRHPLVRSVVWADTSVAERRSAHASLAVALENRAAARLRHRAESASGFDDALGAELLALADVERAGAGYAAASVIEERAAALLSAPSASLDALAAAVEDAMLGGDVGRVRLLVDRVVGQPIDVSPHAHARALLCAGSLEQLAGSVPRSAELLSRAAELGSGSIRIRALLELMWARYRLGSAAGMIDAADAIERHAAPDDPEHAMLVAFSRAAALAYSGDLAGAQPEALRAFELLESTPSLRDNPAYLAATGLAAFWVGGQLPLALATADRRLAAARAVGAIGSCRRFSACSPRP